MSFWRKWFGGGTKTAPECKIQFGADGKVLAVEVPQGEWTSVQKGSNKYCTQKGGSLLQATEILKRMDWILPLTYYVVETPDGSLGRDKQGFYTEAALKTKNLVVGSMNGHSEPVECAGLTGCGDMQANTTTVALLRREGQYSQLILLMKCGHCGYESPVETTAGSFTRQCYCCGTTNKVTRGKINVFVGTGMVEV